MSENGGERISMTLTRRANIATGLVIVVAAFIFVIIMAIIAMPQQSVPQENNKTIVVPIVPSPTVQSTVKVVEVSMPTKVYLGDIFSQKLYPLDKETAIKRLNFFGSWRNRTLNNLFNVENAEKEMDQKMREYVPDQRFKVRFIPGKNISKIVYSTRGEIQSVENVTSEVLPEEYTSYLLEVKDPMDRTGRGKIDVVFTFNPANDLVAISWPEMGAIEIIKGIGGNDSDGSSGTSSSEGGSGGGSDSGSAVGGVGALAYNLFMFSFHH